MSTKITPSLYQIADDLSAIIDRLIDAGGVIDEDTEAALAALEGALEAKVERCALAVRSLEAAATAAKVEADRLADLAASRAKSATRLKEYVQQCMGMAECRKVETDLVRVSVVRNSRPSIRWTGDEAAIPDDLARVRREFDGQAAYLRHKAGDDLPAGVEVVQGEHLRIT